MSTIRDGCRYVVLLKLINVCRSAHVKTVRYHGQDGNSTMVHQSRKKLKIFIPIAKQLQFYVFMLL